MADQLMAPPMRLGIVGYGLGGRRFHAPFVAAADGVEVAGVVTTAPLRKAQVRDDLPGVPVYDDLAQMLRAGVDAVTVTTPPATRHDLVLEAVAAGVHVVADKPFGLNEASAEEMVAAAEDAGVVLSVFHNRRWDADIVTVAAVLASGEVGRPWRFYSRLDLDQPNTLDLGPDGGLLRDLGSHLIDQALWLFGPATSVTAHLDTMESDHGPTDAGFVVQIRHLCGVTSVLEASKANWLASRELRLYGSAGSYQASSTDVQASAAVTGTYPAADPAGWGYEPVDGIVSTAGARRAVRSEQGRYHDFYTAFAGAVRGDCPVPVTPAEALLTMRVLDAARISHEHGRSIQL